MRQKKIRGHSRRQKQIDIWRLDNLSLDLNDYLLNERDRYYTKIRIHPWSGISLTKSVTPEPTGKTKQKMLNGLIDIYEYWENQLNKLEQPYYLKIWLFDPRFSQSQVVCAIGDNVDFYENAFYKPEINKTIQLDNFGSLKTKLSKLNWDYRIDEDHYDNNYVGEPEFYASRQDYEETKMWFDKLLKKPHRTHKFKEPIGAITESYLFKSGEIWLGGQNKKAL